MIKVRNFILAGAVILGVWIVVSLVLSGDAFAVPQSLMPVEKSLQDMNSRDKARFNQEQADRKSGEAEREAAADVDARQSAREEAARKAQERARRREINEQAHAANRKLMEDRRAGAIGCPGDWRKPDDSICPAVRRDMQQRITTSDLISNKHSSCEAGEAFWVKDRDGTLRLVDPLISQGLQKAK